MEFRSKVFGKKFLWPILMLILETGSVSIASDTSKESSETEYVLNSLVDHLHYSNYLKEVLQLLGNETNINAKIYSKSHDVIKNANLVEDLEKTSEKIRTQLDEAKRIELDRIRRYTAELKLRGHSEHVLRSSVKSSTKHLDLKDLTKFGSEDLRKLILQANAELAILDGKRRQTFKEYEMHKTLEFEELVKRLSPAEQDIAIKNHALLMAQHKRAKPIHMPASKDHLLEVWEERDRMSKDNFNIKTFFHLHDLDGNEFLDEYEIKMILENELDDAYNPNTPGYDPKEKAEELERMREYAFDIIDTDKDHLISLEEFIENTKRTGYDDHVFWETMKGEPVYTAEEYAAYAELNRAEVNRIIDEGKISLNLTGTIIHEHNTNRDTYQK